MDLNDVKPQVPAEGIMKMKAPGFYRIACSCGCEEHDITMDVDNDEDGEKTIILWTKVKTPWWRERISISPQDGDFLTSAKRTINGAINRITIAWTALTKGYVEMEADVILSKQQAISLAKLLEDHAKK